MHPLPAPTAESLRLPFYRQLYFQVVLAIVLGVLLGHFEPAYGEALKPLGDAFIKLVKMIIAPVIFLTIVTGIAGMSQLSTVGRVMPGVEVVIRDDDFKPQPTGRMGLITVKTPVRFDGYWLDPEKSRETLRDGWVVMGDLGYYDAAGYLHVLGRSADRVARIGQLLNPREVEEVAHTHSAVKEACLVQHGPLAGGAVGQTKP